MDNSLMSNLRLKHCLGCPKYKNGACWGCKCNFHAKLKTYGTYCPLHKWGPGDRADTRESYEAKIEDYRRRHGHAEESK